MQAVELREDRLSPHFTLSELTFSQTAVRILRLPNTPNPAELSNLRRLATKLEEVRTLLRGRALLVSSGFRSGPVNKAVGGARTSAHLFGLAADFTAPMFGSPRAICERLLAAGLEFDELIFEGTWVHLAIAQQGFEARQNVLTACFNPGKPTTYLKGIV